MNGSDCFEFEPPAERNSGLPLSLLNRDSGLSAEVVTTFINDAWGSDMPPLTESGLGILGGDSLLPPIDGL